jgi:hypothetical protein
MERGQRRREEARECPAHQHLLGQAAVEHSERGPYEQDGPEKGALRQPLRHGAGRPQSPLAPQEASTGEASPGAAILCLDKANQIGD